MQPPLAAARSLRDRLCRGAPALFDRGQACAAGWQSIYLHLHATSLCHPICSPGAGPGSCTRLAAYHVPGCLV
jgi:hypothetical protein